MQNKNRGAAMVEFALVVPFFFMLMCSIIYGGLVMHDITSLNEITRNAARYGSVIESGISDDDKRKAIVKYVRDKAKGSLVLYKIEKGTDVEIIDSELTVGNTGSDSSSKDKSIQITVEAKMDETGMLTLFLDYFPEDLKTISSTLTMRRED